MSPSPTAGFSAIVRSMPSAAGISVRARRRTPATRIFGFTSDLHQNPSFSEGFQQGDKPSYTDRISRSTSFYLNGNYSYRNRYLFDASLRMDGSSVLGSENLFTTTWAVGVGGTSTTRRAVQGRMARPAEAALLDR